MKKQTVLLFTLLCLLITTVKAQEKNSLLWKVEGDNIQTSYVFGTIHMLPKDDFLMPQKVKDASITAAVKVKLLANSNTDGSDINVDTSWQSVVLKGHVKSSGEKDLAEKIASNTEDVLKVTNQLKVDKSKD